MLINKIIKKENTSYICHTLKDLIESYKLELDELLLEKLEKFPVNDEYDVIYDTYYIITVGDNPIHIFHGISIDVNNSPDYNIILDFKHYRVYYIGQSKAGNSIHTYNMEGCLLSQEDLGLKSINMNEFIEKHFIEYNCTTVSDLLDNFNLNNNLSSLLKKHEIYHFRDLHFNEYFIQDYNEDVYYVFMSNIKGLVFDISPPIYYINANGKDLYVYKSSLKGTFLEHYDSSNKLVSSKVCDYGGWNLRELIKS